MQSFFNLRRQVIIVAVVPKWLACSNDSRCQFAKLLDLLGSAFDRVQPADCFDSAAAPLAKRHAHSISFRQATTFVGNCVNRLLSIKTMVNRADKLFQLLPHRLLIGKRLDSLVA